MVFHTSAGRIPSDMGYRLYVDTMLGEKEKEVEEMKEMLLEREDRMEACPPARLSPDNCG